MTVETLQTTPIENPAYSLVVPIRNRYEHMLRNCLKSVELQTLENVELIIVDYGSTHENIEKTLDMAPPCTIYRYETTQPWNLSTARNIGLRRANAEYVGTLDGDLIMEPSVLDLAHKIHTLYEMCYITTRVILLSQNAIPPSAIELPRSYEEIANSAYIKRAEGWGGFISAPALWWKECRGFDERMKWWGWEDVDMWKRVARARLTRSRLQKIGSPNSEVYHQYHTNVQTEALQQKNMPIYEAIMLNEHYAKHTKGIYRNTEKWGRWSED